MVQYRGYGMSFRRQYHHAKKRSDKIPLEYLYRLIVAAIRAKISILEGSPSVRREHVKHFIGTLDDRDLAKQLMVLRLEDADDMEKSVADILTHRKSTILECYGIKRIPTTTDVSIYSDSVCTDSCSKNGPRGEW